MDSVIIGVFREAKCFPLLLTASASLLMLLFRYRIEAPSACALVLTFEDSERPLLLKYPQVHHNLLRYRRPLTFCFQVASSTPD